jgi:hypothetical protein
MGSLPAPALRSLVDRMEFRIGQGKKSFTLAPTDPVTGVEYGSDLRLGQVFDCTTATLRNGLLPPATPRDFPFKSVSWKTTRSLPSRAHNTPRARAREGPVRFSTGARHPLCPRGSR